MEPQDRTMASSNWSSLPDEIWSLVIEKLPLEDFIRCQCVCSSWFSIIGDLKGCSSEQRFPWLMLPPKDFNDPSKPFRFFDITNNKMHQIQLPGLHLNKIHGSSNGWLILRDINIKGDLRLFNPFTKAQIQLPALEYFRESYISISLNGGYTVVVYYGNANYDHPSFSFVNTGDKSWTGIDFAITENRHGNWKGALSKGLFYVLDDQGHIRSFDLNHCADSDNPHPHWLPFQIPPSVSPFDGYTEYLVVLPENDKPLLIQLSISENNTVIKAFGLGQNQAEEIKNLGEKSLFLVNGACSPTHNFISITHATGLIKKNCIYIADEKTLTLKVFDMESQSITGIHPLGNKAESIWGQPVWVNPMLVRL